MESWLLPSSFTDIYYGLVNKNEKKLAKEISRLNRRLDSFIKERVQPGRSRSFRGLLSRVGAIFLAFVVLFPPFIVPVAGRISSHYFIRQDPVSGIPLDFKLHKGIDIAAPLGTPVQGTAIGLVSRAGYTESAGNFVEVSHLFGFSSYYAHLSKLNVKPGSLIIPGLLRIGLSGASGKVSGAHLHFELRFFGWRLPPEIFLAIDWLRRGCISWISGLFSG